MSEQGHTKIVGFGTDDTTVEVCRGEHDKALGCVWETFVPEVTIATQRAELAAQAQRIDSLKGALANLNHMLQESYVQIGLLPSSAARAWICHACRANSYDGLDGDTPPASLKHRYWCITLRANEVTDAVLEETP